MGVVVLLRRVIRAEVNRTHVTKMYRAVVGIGSLISKLGSI
jgi:hypothetical protein